ncbi:MAG TPA: isoamylase early set domain-containing protein [Verrucomicrobiae bacterium]|jgi:1,4-alpha-glucan branching enzyme
MSHSQFRPPHSPNHYSPRKTVKPVSFIYLAPDAQRVSVMGDFNDWDPDAFPMKRHVDGSWQAQVPLPHGAHHYLFVIDGHPVLDPRAQGNARNEQGGKVSMVLVS